ncbi:Arylsulfatase [Crateriforma conspicua]|uniref:alpha-L-fucosidase n=2 Tax=Crateriforma conspicua TaxID=2527996 RepID=A0A5C5Y8U1_9PLAN|nr:Arylsulfatase [Crateriforma conspicua]
MTNKSAILAVFVLLGNCGAGGGICGEPTARPNVVLIFADDMGYGEIEALNPERSKIPTPALNQLAAEGKVFTDAHTSSSVSSPSRYSLLTGRYSWRSRLQRGVLTGGGEPLIADDRVTLASLFRRQGYQTAIFGKWHLEYHYQVPEGLKNVQPNQAESRYAAPVPVGTHIPDGPITRGFDTFLGFHHSRSMSSLVRDDRIIEEIDVVEMLPRLTEEVVQYIDAHASDSESGKPFFLYLPLNSPHSPIVPAAEWEGKGGMGPYSDFVAQTDGAVAEVLKALERNHLSDDTIVIFSTDNGTSRIAKIPDLQAKGHFPSAGFRGSKADLWDGGHRVPFIVRWPGVIKPSSTSDQLVCLTDIMATFAEYFSVDLSDDVAEDSISFLNAMLDRPGKNVRTSVVHHSIAGHFSIRQGGWKLLLAPGSGGWTAPVGVAAIKAGLPEMQLYRINEDFGERHNVIEQYPDKAKELLTLLESYVAKGRSTPGQPQSNDAEIDLWKKTNWQPKRKKNAKSELVVSNAAKTGVAATGPTKRPYDGSWEALQKMPVPEWFDDGKIGIFIHWGPYSEIGYRKGSRGYAEHVPKLLYEDPGHYYPYMQERWGGKPPEFGYKDIVPEFKAEKWDPDQWAQLFEEVGAKYVVFTAEHHDGWANWDSDLTPWNAVEMGPKRDLVGDLGKALRQHGLKYAPSYHRERHTGFFAQEKYVVHSEPREDIAEEIRRMPQAASLYGPFSYSKAFVDDYVARWKEIQEKYHPDMLWVDDFPIYTRNGNQVRSGRMKPEIKYLDDQMRRMITDFMNDAADRGQQVYCNNKGGNPNWPAGVGCLEKDNLKLKVIGPKWQSCTTFGSSFGYLEGDRYRTVESVIHELVEVVSRNGNFLINIGPKGDGTLVPEQVERLRAMGQWLKINGDAIYGSRYWKVSDQGDERLVFTTKGNNLYAIKMEEPSEPFKIVGTAGWKSDEVRSVRLLGADANVSWSMTPQGLRIVPPDDSGISRYAWAFEIVTIRNQHVPNVIQNDADEALKGTRKVDLEGHDLSEIQNLPGTSVVIETANSPEGFQKLVPKVCDAVITTNHMTSNDPVALLTDGKLEEGFGPVFKNGVRNGAYKLDLGAVHSISSITSWSHNQRGFRGHQRIALFGSDASTDPGWDLRQYVPLGKIDTSGQAIGKFRAASLRSSDEETLGKFRWIVWAVAPITAAGGGENTAFQELSVEFE